MMRWMTACAVLALAPHGLVAQAETAGPIVEVRGAGLVELEPDYAVLTVGVSVSHRSISEVTAEMAERLDRVSHALTEAGVPPDSIPSSTFAVRPDYDFDDGRELKGFSADVSLAVRTRDLTGIGGLIAAVLDAGATDVSGVQFRSTEAERARDEALALAFSKAEREASALAEASGHGLGRLLFMTTQPTGSAYTALALNEIVVSNLAVVVEMVRVSAEVTARWELTR